MTASGMAGPRRWRFRVHCWARVGKKQLPVISHRRGNGPQLSVISVQSEKKKYLMFVAVLLRGNSLAGWLENLSDRAETSGRLAALFSTEILRGFWLTMTLPPPPVFHKCSF